MISIRRREREREGRKVVVSKSEFSKRKRRAFLRRPRRNAHGLVNLPARLIKVGRVIFILRWDAQSRLGFIFHACVGWKLARVTLGPEWPWILDCLYVGFRASGIWMVKSNRGLIGTAGYDALPIILSFLSPFYAPVNIIARELALCKF